MKYEYILVKNVKRYITVGYYFRRYDKCKFVFYCIDKCEENTNTSEENKLKEEVKRL